MWILMPTSTCCCNECVCVCVNNPKPVSWCLIIFLDSESRGNVGVNIEFFSIWTFILAWLPHHVGGLIIIRNDWWMDGWIGGNWLLQGERDPSFCIVRNFWCKEQWEGDVGDSRTGNWKAEVLIAFWLERFPACSLADTLLWEEGRRYLEFPMVLYTICVDEKGGWILVSILQLSIKTWDKIK